MKAVYWKRGHGMQWLGQCLEHSGKLAFFQQHRSDKGYNVRVPNTHFSKYFSWCVSNATEASISTWWSLKNGQVYKTVC